MSDFYIIGQDKQKGGPIIDIYPEDIDILDFISGKKLSRSDDPVMIELAESSSNFMPDMVTYLLPLFSDNLKNILADLGVDNIDYYPVIMREKSGAVIENKYWLANIIGLISCVDVEKSDVSIHPLSKKIKIEKSFVLTDTLLAGQKIFRIAEERPLIIVSQQLKDALEKRNLQGVRLINTRDYEGY